MAVLLVDTVGFVSRLPHNLVEAFKSTLEEAAWSDVIVRVADAGDDQREEQLAVTDEVLDGLDCADIPRLTVYNKCDKPNALNFDPDILLTSAKTGYGLDALLREKQYKLCGILNGIDMEANNPATDPKIPFNYDVTNVEEGKAKCKEALQDKFGLHKDGSPVFAMVSRMVGMKGFDLVQSIADGLVDRGIELVILGSGENQYETFFSDLCARHPGRVGTYIGFEPALSQEIYAGADVFIMPSKSEPCGLAQMVACRYGTPPIVRETGGLRDSIHDCTLGEGNGFTFAGYSAHELYDACCRAQDRYYNKEDWNNLVKHDMECDFSWDLSAKSYEGLYNETANLW